MESTNHFKRGISKSLLLFVLVVGSAFHSACKAQSLKRALFLGNSYTAYNNLPQLTADVALSAGDTLEVASSTPGGYTFEGHLGNAASMDLLNQGNWDFVILQQQSQMPAFPISQVEVETFPFATQLNDSILANNPCAETVFYMTWGRENGDQQNCANWPPVCTYEGMDDLLRERYMMMAEMNEGIVSPVSVVWRYLRANHPDINLFSSDGSHPSPTGSYVAAVCFYSALFRKSPLNALFDYTIDNAHESIIRQTVHDLVYNNLSEWYIGYWDPVAQLTLVEQNNSPYAIVQSSEYADEIYYSIDNLELQPWSEDSLFMGPLEPGDHIVELYAGSCGVWDTTSVYFDLVVNAIASIVELELSVFPNPASNQVRIELPNNWNDVTLDVFTTQGKWMMSTQNAGRNQVSIDCTKFPKGSYTIVMKQGNQKASGTFIVVK
jgi:hypothetical protein